MYGILTCLFCCERRQHYARKLYFKLFLGDQGEVEEEEVKKETKIEKEALPAVEVVVDLVSEKSK